MVRIHILLGYSVCGVFRVSSHGRKLLSCPRKFLRDNLLLKRYEIYWVYSSGICTSEVTACLSCLTFEHGTLDNTSFSE
jgi:hypothetical protein